jgi:hypothetical protein
MNPLVFSEILHDQPSRLKGNHALMLDVLFRYMELLREDFQESACGGKFKQLASQMCRGAPWRKQLLQLNSMKDHEALLLAVREGRWRPTPVSIEEQDASEVSCDMYSA